MLDGTPVLAMSVSGMLAMKEQFPHLRNGRRWRQKDIGDIEILRGLAAEQRDDGDVDDADTASWGCPRRSRSTRRTGCPARRAAGRASGSISFWRGSDRN
jgi:hypothetical protein